jgi:hypothetical protein
MTRLSLNGRRTYEVFWTAGSLRGSNLLKPTNLVWPSVTALWNQGEWAFTDSPSLADRCLNCSGFTWNLFYPPILPGQVYKLPRPLHSKETGLSLNSYTILQNHPTVAAPGSPLDAVCSKLGRKGTEWATRCLACGSLLRTALATQDTGLLRGTGGCHIHLSCQRKSWVLSQFIMKFSYIKK